MAFKRDKQRARQIAKDQKDRQRLKAAAPPAPVAPPSPAPSSVSGASSLLLTVAQLGELLNLSRSTLCRMEKAGQLPGRVQLGGKVRYHREIVEAWLRSLVKS